MVVLANNRSIVTNPMYSKKESNHLSHTFHYKLLKVTKLEFLPKYSCKINKKFKITIILIPYILKVNPIAIRFISDRGREKFWFAISDCEL
jgi:hypothetical protein